MMRFLGIVICTLLLGSFSANAQEKKALLQDILRVKIGTFNNYPPFGWVDYTTVTEGRTSKTISYTNGFAATLTKDILEEIDSELSSKKLVLEIAPNIDVGEALKRTPHAEIDLVFGAYYSDKEFLGYDFLYPAVIANPVVVAVRNDAISNIKTWGDLDNLKGVAIESEDFGEFVNRQIRSEKNVTLVKNAKEAFEALTTEKADFVYTSSYSGQAEAVRLGIRHKVGFVRQPRWNSQLFFVISSSSNTKRYIKDEFEKKLKERIKNGKIAETLRKSMDLWESKHKNVSAETFEKSNVQKNSKE